MKGLKTVVIAAVGMALLATAAPAGTRTPAYTTFVACGYKKDRPATIKRTHLCRRGEVVGAFFRRNLGEPGSLIHYKVCVKFPAGPTKCRGGQPARKLGRRMYVNRILNPGPGRYKVTWFVKGKRVGTWYFRLVR